MKRELKVSKEHPHCKECDDFDQSLKYGLIMMIEDEPQIRGSLPKGSKAGNVLTGETYDPKDFILNMVIKYCPFCSKEL